MAHFECVTSKRNKWYWYLLVLLLCLFVSNTIGALPLMVIIILSMFKSGDVSSIDSLSKLDFETMGMDKNLALAAMLFSFVTILLAAVVFIRLFHRRTWTEVINGTYKVRWTRILVGFSIWGILAIISFGISYFYDNEGLEFTFKPVQFLILCLISLIFIPIQSSSEEFLFRGYLAQGVASWTKSRWWALIVPSILFALMHSLNPEIKEYGFGVMMIQYLLMGLIFGFISIMDDGIELAMGIHTANNLLACLLVNYEGSALQTDALFTLKDLDPAGGIVELVVFAVVAIAIFTYIYKWKFSVINEKVQLPNEDEQEQLWY